MKPSIYLDWSVFQLAFEGSLIGAEVWKKELHNFIFRLSEQTDLCFSSCHLLDMLNGDDKTLMTAKAAWLEQLNLQYLKSPVEIGNLEYECLTNFIVTGEIERFSPYTESFITMVHENVSPSLSAALLSDIKRGGTIREYCKQIINASRSDKISMEKLNAFSLRASEMLAVNRATNEIDSREQKEELLRINRISALKKECLLRKPSFADKINEFDFDDESKYRTLIPYNYILSRTINAAAERLKAKDPKSKKFETNESNVMDWQHLIGAAYCDYFTCDNNTSKDLGGLRSKFGFSLQKETPNTSNYKDFISDLSQIIGVIA